MAGAAVVPRLASADLGAPEPAPTADAIAPAPAPALAPAPAEVRALFGSLREGSPISTHWRLESIHAVRGGALPVVLSTIYGGRFAVEIFRAEDDGPRPIARAGQLALHLVNHGSGSTATAELAGLGVMALGRELERSVAGRAIPAELTTYRQRIASDPNGSFDIALS